MSVPIDPGVASPPRDRGRECERPCRPNVGRRHFLALAAGVLGASLPAAVRAQPAAKIHQIGSLIYGSAVEFEDRIRALRAGLR
ncbi:MAG TPA: hypothetical protein VFY43_08035, partial [Candidatus Limnocylindria bacterium]|nr:hypothetical protein [Candidatus Limnocylindria bacterium]